MLDNSTLDKTLLPFESAITAAKIFGILTVAIIITYFVRAIVYKRALNLKRAPTGEVFYTVIAILFNTALYTFFYWQWALPVSVAISLVFMSATSHEVKEGNTELREGIWGLNKNIRSVRAEIFADLSKDEQLKYKSTVKEYKFLRVRFLAIAILVPILIVVAWHFLNIGYLFFPIDIK